MLQYDHNRASLAQLQAHLQATDAGFTPPLSQRVDLADYAAKLHAHAEREEAWANEQLIGVIACYANDRAAGAYISNVSLLPGWRGQGVADELLRRCLQRASALGLRTAGLHLHPDNAAALRLYERHGFQTVERKPTTLRMTLSLSPAP